MMQAWLNHAYTRQTLIRGLYMLLFWLILTMITYGLGIVVIIQFFFVLFLRQPNALLLAISNFISQYIHHILAFLTFKQTRLPYPFGKWQA